MGIVIGDKVLESESIGKTDPREAMIRQNREREQWNEKYGTTQTKQLLKSLNGQLGICGKESIISGI